MGKNLVYQEICRNILLSCLSVIITSPEPFIQSMPQSNSVQLGHAKNAYIHTIHTLLYSKHCFVQQHFGYMALQTEAGSNVIPFMWVRRLKQNGDCSGATTCCSNTHNKKTKQKQFFLFFQHRFFFLLFRIGGEILSVCQQ